MNPPNILNYEQKSTTRFPLELLRIIANFLLRIIEIPPRYIFGRDIFISYSRHEARKYAPHLAIVVQKRFQEEQKKKLSFYLDRWIAPGTGQLPLSLRMHLRWSNMLVVICTPRAVASNFVKDEVRRFGKLRRKVLVIDVDDTFESVRGQEPWADVGGADPESEISTAIAQGKPSDEVVSRILKMQEFTTQDRRLHRAVWGTLAFVTLSIGAAAFSFFSLFITKAQAAEAEAIAIVAEVRAQTASSNADEAERRARVADDQVAQARVESANAQDAKLAAEGQRDGAIRERNSAKAETTVALTAKAQAETDAKNATIERDKAKADAETQSKIAREQQLLAEDAKRQRELAIIDTLDSSASLINNSRGDLSTLQPAVSTVLQKYRDWNPDEKIVPTSLHLALTDALKSAKEQGFAMGVGDFPMIRDFDISPNGSLLVTVGYPRPENKQNSQPAASLWDVRTRQLVWELPPTSSKVTACAISPESTLLALGFEDGKLLFFSINGTKFELNHSLQIPAAIGLMKFTSNGGHVLIWANKQWNGTNLYLADVVGGNPKALKLPATSRRLHFGNAYNYNGGELEGAFAELQQAPAFVGVLDLYSHFTTVNTDTGEQQEYNLGQKHISRYTGELNLLQASLLSPDGRWFLGVPYNNGGLQTSPFLIDLNCVNKKRTCNAVYPLGPIQTQSQPQLAFDPGSRLLFITAAERSLRVYRIEQIQARESATPGRVDFPSSFEFKGFTSDGKQLVVITNNSKEGDPAELRIYDFERNSLTHSHSLGSEAWYHGLIKQAVKSTFEIGVYSQKLYIWEQNPSPGFQFVYDKQSVGIDIGQATDATVAPDGKLIASAHPYGFVAIWRVADRQLLGIVRGLRSGEIFIEWGGTAQSPALYVASRAGQVFKWTSGGSLLNIAPSGLTEVTQFQITKDGTTLMVLDGAGVARILAHDRWTKVTVGQRPVALSEDGSQIAVADDTGGGSIINIASRQVKTLTPSNFIPCAADAIHFAMSNTLVVTESCRGVMVWRASGGAPLAEPQPPFDLPRSVTAPTSELWARYEDGYITITNLKNGKLIAQVPGRGTAFQEGTDVNLGGKRTVFDFAQRTNLAAAGRTSDKNESVVEIWKLDSGEELSYLPYAAESKRIQFMPSGDALVLVGANGVPVMVPLDSKGQFETLCPVIWTSIDRVESLRKAYGFCRSVYDDAKSGKLHQQGEVWVLDAANGR